MKVRTLALFTTAITSVGWSVSATAQDQVADTPAQEQTQADAPRSTADRVTQRLEKRGEANTDGDGDIVVVGTRNAIANSIDTKRASSAQIDVITAEDVEALAILLGARSYFLGEQPRTLDAVAHAFLAGMLAFPVDAPVKEAIAAHANLIHFVERMNARFYPPAHADAGPV